MKRLLLVLPLLCGLAFGQEYNKEQYEKDLKDYNNNKEVALKFAANIQSKKLEINTVMSVYADSKVMLSEIKELEDNIAKLNADAEHLFSEGYFSDCFESAQEINNIFKAEFAYEQAVIEKDENSIKVANTLRFVAHSSYDTVFSYCLKAVSESPTLESYPLLNVIDVKPDEV